MGLSDVDSFEHDMRSRGVKVSILPESLLRKDDVFYEDVKNVVEKGFQACKARQNTIDDVEELCEVNNISRFILTLLDDLSNNGLWSLAKIVTRGSISFDKTHPKMKRVIKNSLQEICSNCLDSNTQCQMQNQLSQLLKNPKNFCRNHGKYIKKTRKSFFCALEKVDLRSIPVRILYAMHRKLKGTQDFMPQLCPRESGWNKDRLILRVIKLCKKMINQRDETDKLQYPLVKAMAVPSLYSKIASNYQDLSLANFVNLPPEVEALQDEIVKAIWTLDQTFKKEELKNLQLLLDPESKVDANSLRKAIRTMLIDCLFGCSDMEAVPNSLLQALSLINKKSCKSHRFSSKDVIEEEVECILDVGAHIKQLVWDSVPIDELDQDFADAYMEELEESDDGDIFDDDDQKLHMNILDEVQIRFNDFGEEVASTGDADHANISSATSTYKDNVGNSDESSASFTDRDTCRDTGISGGEMQFIGAGDGPPPLVSSMLQEYGEMIGSQNPPDKTSVDSMNLSEDCLKQNSTSEHLRNRYVAIQQVCDQASLVAYQLVGYVLAEVGQMEALDLTLDNELYLRSEFSRSENFQVSDSKDKGTSGSIIVQSVHEVIPSFPSSQLELVKKFMSS